MPIRLTTILLLAALPLFAQTNTARLDAKAAPVLKAMADYYAKAPGFRVDMEADTRIEAEDMKQEFTTRAMLAVKKPDKLAFSVHNSLMSLVVVSDGATLTTFMPALNKYTSRPAPDSLEQMSADMGAASPACLPVISALLEKDPHAALLRQADRIRYAGKEKRGGVACHRLTFTHRDFDCDAWIREGDTPLLEAIQPCLSKMGAAGKLPGGMKADAILRLSGWDLSNALPDSLFAIALPPEAQKVEALLPGMEEAGEADDETHPGEELVGEPAPPMAMNLLEGGRFDLAAHKGTNAVLLCFWTTWANPCRQALPMLQKVAAAYAGKSAAVFTINPQDSPDEVKAFLKAANVTLPVAVDAEGKAAEACNVAGIPHILLIDKGGIVRHVFLGYGEELEQELKDKLAPLVQPEKIPQAK